jgi:hypothetical protein
MKQLSCIMLTLLLLPAGRVLAQPNPGMYFLNTGNELTVPIGGKVNLKVFRMDAEADPHLFEAVWTLNGRPWGQANAADGQLAQQIYAGAAEYIAPLQAPPRNPVAVTVAFRLSDTSKTQLILTCNITITNTENYFCISNCDICHGFNEFAKPMNAFMQSMMTTATFIDGELIINIQGSDIRKPANVLSMAVEVAGNSPGTYPWSITYNKNKGTIPPSNMVSVGGMACKGSFISMDAVPHDSENSTPISLKGSTTITRYDQQKKILQGYFGGQVLITVNKEYRYAHVYGRFTVHLK